MEGRKEGWNHLYVMRSEVMRRERELERSMMPNGVNLRMEVKVKTTMTRGCMALKSILTYSYIRNALGIS